MSAPGNPTPAPGIPAPAPGTITSETPTPATATTPKGLADLPIAELLQRLNAGQLDPEQISRSGRRTCIGQLALEGFTISEIAQLMHMSERTVRRDRDAYRAKAAVAPTATLGDELFGEMERLALAGVQRLTRLARDTENPPYARLWAEEAILRLYQRFVETARKLSYLRDGAQRLDAAIENDPITKFLDERDAENLRRRFYGDPNKNNSAMPPTEEGSRLSA